MSKARQAADEVNRQQAGRRNLIINGAMQVAQRGTSKTGITSSQYTTVDRFKFAIDSCGTWTSTQESDAPDGFAKSYKIECTTADSSISSSDYVISQYYFEGQDLQHLKYGTSSAKQLTLSFWVKSNKTGTYTAELQVDNASEAPVQYTVNSSGTWEYKSLTFTGNTSDSLTNDNGLELAVNFWVAAGSTWTSGTYNESTWQNNTNGDRAVGNVNLADTVGNYWQITGVQLEVGDVATPFEHRSYGEELALCQRYFWAQVPKGEATGGAANSGQYPMGSGGYLSTSQVELVVHFPTAMRSAPSLSIASGTNYFVAESNGGGNDYFNSLTGWGQKKQSSLLFTSSGTSGTAGQMARLAAANTNSYIYWDAEL